MKLHFSLSPILISKEDGAMVDEELICTLYNFDGNNPRKGKLMMQSVLSVVQLYLVIPEMIPSESVFFLYKVL